MATLAGRFAGILLVAVPPDRGEELVAALRAVQGLNLLIEEGEFDPVESEDLWTLTLTGSDQPGIVQQVTAAVVKAGGSLARWQSDRARDWAANLEAYDDDAARRAEETS